MIDEISKVNKQNSQYRSFILDNESKFEAIMKEVEDLQKMIDLQKKQQIRQAEETEVYKKQI